MPLLAVDRIETWVVIVSVALPIVALVGLALWHLASVVSARRMEQRKAVRESPEPVRPDTRSERERLEQACAALAQSLAEKYLELADFHARNGDAAQAAAALRKVVQCASETPVAEVARDRLRSLGA